MAEESTAAEPQEEAATAAAENPAMEGSRTYTQEEFDAEVKKMATGAIRERIDRANAKHQKEVEELAARNGELEGQVKDMAEELAEYKRKEQAGAWAAEVSKETGVPADAIRGETKEEMMAHAETLRGYISKPSAPYVGSDGFASGKGDGKDAELRQFAHSFFSSARK